jgi:hypothetical protein
MQVAVAVQHMLAAHQAQVAVAAPLLVKQTAQR